MAAPYARKSALRFDLGGKPASLTLDRVRRVVGYATLHGEPDEYFLGWLRLQTEDVPVFDLGQVLSERPTPATFGSRIIVADSAADGPSRSIGLLAAGVTDTIASDDASAPTVAWDSFVPMLLALIPDGVTPA